MPNSNSSVPIKQPKIIHLILAHMSTNANTDELIANDLALKDRVVEDVTDRKVGKKIKYARSPFEKISP